ncbi:hypothetical protein NP568_25910, partial [Vibrio parahaemolyticus]|nr:hypothetical protein [Vibrio parahaemolyticus]
KLRADFSVDANLVRRIGDIGGNVLTQLGEIDRLDFLVDIGLFNALQGAFDHQISVVSQEDQACSWGVVFVVVGWGG